MRLSLERPVKIPLAFLRFQVLSSIVIRHLMVVALGIAGFSLSARAGETTITRSELEKTGAFEVGTALQLGRPDLFQSVDGASLIHGLPVLALLDGRRFPISSDLTRMGWAPLNVMPLAFISAVDVHKSGSSLRYGSDAPAGAVDLRLKRFYTGGEVGFFYGRSSGKYGREDYSAHIIGGIGNEKFNLTVGAAYSESEVRVPQGRR